MRIKDLLNQKEETPEKIEMEKSLEGRVLQYGRIKLKTEKERETKSISKPHEKPCI